MKPKKPKKRCYISGKMRGLKEFGFPLFDQARDIMRSKGWQVVSPADMDRQIGFDPNEEGYDFDINEAMRRDIQVLLFMDAIVLLPNWRDSHGAAVELVVAQEIGIPAYELNLDTKRLRPLKSKEHVSVVRGGK